MFSANSNLLDLETKYGWSYFPLPFSVGQKFRKLVGWPECLRMGVFVLCIIAFNVSPHACSAPNILHFRFTQLAVCIHLVKLLLPLEMIKSKVCPSACPHWKWEGCICFPPSFAQRYSTSAALPAHGVRCVLSKLSQCCTALPNTQSWQGYRWHPIYNNVLQSLMVPQTLMKSIKAGPSQFHCPWSVGILCASVDLDMSGCLAWDMEEWHYTLMPTQTSAVLIMTRSSFGMILTPISETPPIWVDSSVWEVTLVAKTHGHGSVAELALKNNEHQYVGCSQTTQCKRGEGDISIVVTHRLRWDLSCFHSIVKEQRHL